MRSRPTAKIADGRFVLNLPDAETPALWIMELADAQASVIRLEADKGGLYVLKKHGAGKAETIAVYRERNAGIRAMNVATSALARGVRGGVADTGVCGFACGRAGRIFTYFVMVWFLLWSINLTPYIMRLVLSPFISSAPAGSAAVTPQDGGPDTASVPPAGVPLSADEFLNNQSGPAN